MTDPKEPCMTPTVAELTARMSAYLAQTRKEEVVLAGGKKTLVERHPTDPPHGYVPVGRNAPDPGPLPRLVALDAIPKGAKILPDHEHGAALPVTAEHLDHMLHHVVMEARRARATAFAFREPVVQDGMFTLVVVNVLSPVPT